MQPNGPTERFSNRVADYVRYRPGYPPALLDWLHRDIGVPATTPVADIGAGTGISTRLFLEALGYQVNIIYEKWRTKYLLNDLEIDLDEMPFGHFVEIEGDDSVRIERMAAMLALNWGDRVTDSYIKLFERVKNNLHLDVKNLTFGDFKDYKVLASDLGLHPGDIVAYL